LPAKTEKDETKVDKTFIQSRLVSSTYIWLHLLLTRLVSSRPKSLTSYVDNATKIVTSFPNWYFVYDA